MPFSNNGNPFFSLYPSKKVLKCPQVLCWSFDTFMSSWFNSNHIFIQLNFNVSKISLSCFKSSISGADPVRTSQLSFSSRYKYQFLSVSKRQVKLSKEETFHSKYQQLLVDDIFYVIPICYTNAIFYFVHPWLILHFQFKSRVNI